MKRRKKISNDLGCDKGHHSGKFSIPPPPIKSIFRAKETSNLELRNINRKTKKEKENSNQSLFSLDKGPEKRESRKTEHF